MVFLNRAVGEPFRPMVCRGEDCEPYRTRMPPPRLASSFAFRRTYFFSTSSTGGITLNRPIVGMTAMDKARYEIVGAFPKKLE